MYRISYMEMKTGLRTKWALFLKPSCTSFERVTWYGLWTLVRSSTGVSHTLLMLRRHASQLLVALRVERTPGLAYVQVRYRASAHIRSHMCEHTFCTHARTHTSAYTARTCVHAVSPSRGPCLHRSQCYLQMLCVSSLCLLSFFASLDCTDT